MGDPASLPPHNDGLVEVTAYYMDGPRFLICQPSSVDEVRLFKGRCMKRDSEARLKQRITLVPGVSPQQYLDRRFGAGETVFVGLGKRALSRNVDALVIFYRIPRP